MWSSGLCAEPSRGGHHRKRKAGGLSVDVFGLPLFKTVKAPGLRLNLFGKCLTHLPMSLECRVCARDRL